MCHKCDTPEAREQINEVFEAVGLSDLAGRFMAHRFAVVDEGDDKFWDTAHHGTVTLTRGQYFLLASGIYRAMDAMLGEASQALAMSKMMGVPLDAMVDTDTGRQHLEGYLDALDVIKAAPASDIVIPDDVAALVGESDGSTT